MRQQSPKFASATEPKVKRAPSIGIRMTPDPEVSRCLSPLVGNAGSYLSPGLILLLQHSSPRSLRKGGGGREQWKTNIST